MEIEVYVYTRVRGIVNEHHGILKRTKKGASFRNLHKTHWLVGLSNLEGEVKGFSVWYTYPNYKGAIEALNEKDKERAMACASKCNRTLERITIR